MSRKDEALALSWVLQAGRAGAVPLSDLFAGQSLETPLGFVLSDWTLDENCVVALAAALGVE